MNIIVINDFSTIGGVEKYCEQLKEEFGTQWQIVSLCKSLETQRKTEYISKRKKSSIFDYIKLYYYINLHLIHLYDLKLYLIMIKLQDHQILKI